MSRKFTDKEDKFLSENRNTIPAKRMAKILGRSECVARQRMKLLGCLPSPEAIEKFKKDSQIKPGSVSWNKGKKQKDYMSAANIKKTKATRFKKGSVPPNTKYDGYERTSKDGYVEIRIRKGKFAHKHRVYWEKYRGKIPKGSAVIFKDGNKQNIKISNLKLVSRADLMKMNSYHNYPKPIAQLIQLRGALNRQINKHSKRLAV